MIRQIPNFLTSLNLLSGTLGILYLFNAHFGGDLFPSHDLPIAYFVWFSLIVDFFDGFTARLFKVSSPIGKELDSLADLVSFGLLPSFFIFLSIKGHTQNDLLPYVALLIAVCSAIRLAVFNVDEKQKDSFLGLPTPANALFLTALPFLKFEALDFIHQPWGLAIVSLVFSLLLVSRFELFALKFKDFLWASNKIRFTFLALAVLLIGIFKLASLPLIVLLYLFMSLGGNAVARINARKT